MKTDTWKDYADAGVLARVTVRLIAPEEKYLSAKFKDEYINYSASVYRWLGRTGRP